MRVVAVVVALLALCVGPAAAARTPHANLGQMARALVRSGAPGALVYVRTSKVARAGTAGFADVTARTSMRAADRWRIASVSKAFVSAVVLQLEAEGKLDIDDAVERWLPGVVPNGASITLRELMNHTSGLYNYTDDQAFVASVVANPGRVWTPKELVGVAFAHPPLFAPATDWAYSNTNYILLGLVVEAATGNTVADELQRRVFTPLALTATSFPSTIVLAPDFIHGYFSEQRIDISTLLGPSWAWAAGAIVSNARDVTTFYRALLGGRLLPKAQLTEMETPSPVAGTYALGLELTTTTCGRAIGHDGDFFGWRTVVLATPTGKREAIAMVNVDDSYVPWSRLLADVKLALCRG